MATPSPDPWLLEGEPMLHDHLVVELLLGRLVLYSLVVGWLVVRGEQEVLWVLNEW